MEAIQHPVTILDPTYRIVALNPAVTQVTGLGEAELIGKVCHEVFHGGLRDEPPESCPMKALLKSASREPVEMEIETFGGVYLVSCTPVFDEQGETEAIIHIATDITARVSLAKQLRQAQKMEAVGRLAGGMAHDFNNVLTGIGGLAECLLLETDAGTTAHDDLSQIRTLVERGSRLTRSLLAFSRRQSLEFVVLDINEVISRVVSMLGRLIGEDITIEYLPGTDVPNTRADASQLEQVLMNLAVNARDAMPGGGSLRIATMSMTTAEPLANELFEIPAGIYAQLTVSDTGVGMDEKVRKQIFEPFFTTKDRTKGTGLGLASVYGIIKQHNGFITVDSEPQAGATFTILFPEALTEATTTTAGVNRDEAAPRGSEIILVVEDEPTVRAVVKRVLEKQGYDVLVADTPGAARARVAKHGPEVALLLTDVILPDQNGPDLYDALLQQRPDLKVLFMSGYADQEIMERGVRRPGRPILKKPFLPGELARRVREVLDS